MSARFDSLGFVRRLESAGVERRVAEAHAETVRDYIMDEVATKADIQGLRDDLEGQLKLLEQRMTLKLGTLLVIAVGAVTALERLTQ